MVLNNKVCGCAPGGVRQCLLATTACLWMRGRKTILKDHTHLFHWSKKKHSTLSFAKTTDTYLQIFDRSHLNRILIREKCIAFLGSLLFTIWDNFFFFCFCVVWFFCFLKLRCVMGLNVAPFLCWLCKEQCIFFENWGFLKSGFIFPRKAQKSPFWFF